METWGRIQERHNGMDLARVASVDFGQKNLSWWIGNVGARGLVTKADKEESAPIHEGKSRSLDQVPTQAELEADAPIEIKVSNLRLWLQCLEWRRIDMSAVASGEAVIVNPEGVEGGTQHVNVRSMLWFLWINGHLKTFLESMARFKVTRIIFEQQFGPSFRSPGNPPMFVLSNVMWFEVLKMAYPPRGDPPLNSLPALYPLAYDNGPRSSFKTCDLIQKMDAYDGEVKLSTVKMTKTKRKDFKKDQVVHVCDWFMERWKPACAPLYWAAGDKRDDMADCLLQVVSFYREHLGVKVRKAQSEANQAAKETRNGKPTKRKREADEEDGGGGEREEKRVHLEEEQVKAKVEEKEIVVYFIFGKKVGKKGRINDVSYVGYTVDLEHRFKQHCGLLAGGAKSTRGMTDHCVGFYVSGFKAKSHAMSFESSVKKIKGDPKQAFKLGKKHSSMGRRLRSLDKLFRTDKWATYASLRVHWQWCDVETCTLPPEVEKRLA